MRLGTRRIWVGLKKYTICIIVIVFVSILMSLFLLNGFNIPNNSLRFHVEATTTTTPSTMLISKNNAQRIEKPGSIKNDLVSLTDEAKLQEYKMQLYKERVEKLTQNFKRSRSYVIEQNNTTIPKPNYNVHVFYYAWYGNKEFDGAFSHWNHRYLANWKQDDRSIYPTGSHTPPVDLATNYYPLHGPYSSNDPRTIHRQLRNMRDNAIGVLALSWSPPGSKDAPHSQTIRALLDEAATCGIRVALHVEPYHGRNPINMMDRLQEFWLVYGNHPGLLKVMRSGSQTLVPLVYIYDSYTTPAVAWREMLAPPSKSKLSIRGGKYDAMFIGLLADIQHRYHVKKSHFDGFYTYFATNGFTYGSTWKNWKNLSRFASDNGLEFIPSVGPGYIDTQVRPWNTVNTRHRRHGQYYDVAWRTAISTGARFVSVTSWNEWHEGTQIEPARPYIVSANRTQLPYLDYQPQTPDFYLNLTRWWIGQMKKEYRTNSVQQ